MCPPPIIPPPCFCPPPLPPLPCPIPIPCPPPMTCPLPLPPMPCGGGCGESFGVGYQQPQPSYAFVPPVNDCCCQCGSPCRFRSRVKTHGKKTINLYKFIKIYFSGARIFSAATAEIAEDPTCNNEKLRVAIEEVRNFNNSRFYFYKFKSFLEYYIRPFN